MFGFKKKKKVTRSESYEMTIPNCFTDKAKKLWDWRESDDFKRLEHLQTLIIKTFETVNINIDSSRTRISESYTRADFIEDFKVFFKPEVFNKLSEWCKEYETLRDKELKIMENL